MESQKEKRTVTLFVVLINFFCIFGVPLLLVIHNIFGFVSAIPTKQIQIQEIDKRK